MSKRKTIQRVIPYIILVCALLSGIVIARPLLDFVKNQLHQLQNTLISAVEQKLKLKVSYSHLSPSLLLQADIIGLRLERDDGSVLFSADQMRLSYDFFELVFGDPVKSIHHIEMNGGHMFLDTELDAERLSLVKKSANDSASVDIPSQIQELLDWIGSSVPIGLSFSFIDTQVDIKSPDVSLTFIVPEASFIAMADRLELQLGLSASTEASLAQSLGGRFEGSLFLEGQYFRATRQLQTQVSLGQLMTPWGTLARQELALNISSEEIRLNRITDQEPVDLQVRWNARLQTIEAVFQADEWLMRRMFTPRADLGEWESILFNAQYTASVQATWNLNTKLVSYVGEASAHGQWKAPDDVSFHADLKGDSTHFPDGLVHLSLPGALVDFRTNVPGKPGRLAGFLELSLSTPWSPVPVKLESSVSAIIGSSNIHIEAVQSAGAIDAFMLSASDLILDYHGGKLDFKANFLPQEYAGIEPEIELSGRYDPTGSAIQAAISGLRVADGIELARPLGQLFAGKDIGKLDLSFLPKDLTLDAHLAISTIGGLQATIDELKLRSAALDPEGTARTIFSGAGSFADNTLELNQGTIDLPQWHLESSGRMVLDNQGGMTANLRITEGSQSPWNFTISRTSAGHFDVQGPFGLFASGSSGASGIAVQASFANFPVHQIGPLASVSASLAANLDYDGDWSARIQRLDLVSMQINPLAPQKLGRLTLQNASLSASGLLMPDLRYQDPASLMSGRGKLDWKWTALPQCSWSIALKGTPALNSLVVNPQPEALGIDGTWGPEGISSTIRWSDAPLNRFIDETLRGFFDAELDISFQPESILDSLALTGRLSAKRAFINKDSLTLGTAFSFKEKVFRLQGFQGSFLEHQISVDDLLIDLGKGESILSGHYLRMGDQGFQPVLVTGKSRWNAGETSIDSILFDNMSGNLDFLRVPGMDQLVHDYHVDLAGTAGTLSFSESNAQIIRGKILRDGSFQATVKKPFPFAAQISGELHGAQIQANISNISLELGTFARFLDLGMFKLSAGSLSGSLRLVGDINDPDFFGSLRGTNIHARLNLIPEELQAARGVLVFEEKKVRFLSLDARAGTGVGKVEGDFSLSRLNIVGTSIRAEVPQEGTGIHVKGDFPTVSVDGWAKGKISLDWSGNSLRLQGQISAENTALQLYTAPTSAAVDPAAADAEPFYYVVDLGLSSGKGVEFYAPSKALPIIRTYIDLGQTMTLNYNSAQETFSLRGDLKARGGEVTWLKRNFLIRDAILLFNENQASFDPRISGKAEGRIPFQDKIIKIFLQYENNSFSNLLPKVSSDLPISNDQLVSALTGNIINENQNSGYTWGNLYNLVSSASGWATQLLLADQFNVIRTSLGLDMFSVRSDLLTNAAVQAIFSAAPLDNKSLSPGELLTIQAGKFIGTDVYFEGISRLKQTNITGQFDLSNAGNFLSTFGKAAGLGVELELNMDFNTPWFDLNWNWAPKDLTSVERMLKDNTFTFSLRLQ